MRATITIYVRTRATSIQANPTEAEKRGERYQGQACAAEPLRRRPSGQQQHVDTYGALACSGAWGGVSDAADFVEEIRNYDAKAPIVDPASMVASDVCLV